LIIIWKFHEKWLFIDIIWQIWSYINQCKFRFDYGWYYWHFLNQKESIVKIKEFKKCIAKSFASNKLREIFKKSLENMIIIPSYDLFRVKRRIFVLFESYRDEGPWVKHIHFWYISHSSKASSIFIHKTLYSKKFCSIMLVFHNFPFFGLLYRICSSLTWQIHAIFRCERKKIFIISTSMRNAF